VSNSGAAAELLQLRPVTRPSAAAAAGLLRGCVCGRAQRIGSRSASSGICASDGATGISRRWEAGASVVSVTYAVLLL